MIIGKKKKNKTDKENDKHRERKTTRKDSFTILVVLHLTRIITIKNG